MAKTHVPIIDLFAGSGGLSERFFLWAIPILFHRKVSPLPSDLVNPFAFVNSAHSSTSSLFYGCINFSIFFKI